jgi:hypothetical protein
MNGTTCDECREWTWPNLDIDTARYAAVCHVALAHPSSYHAATGRNVEQVVAAAATLLGPAGLTPADLHLIGRAFSRLKDGDVEPVLAELTSATPAAKALMADTLISLKDHPT